jgi:serine/threonine-protein kinase
LADQVVPFDPPEVTPEPVRLQLETILSSSVFSGSASLSRLLRYVVEEVLAGRGDLLKEYALGVQVFERGESFDPRLDPIVRVQARNLRAKLKEYYDNGGRYDPVLIELPKGTYMPVFRRLQPAETVSQLTAGQPETRKRMWTARWLWAVVGMLAVAAAGTVFLTTHNNAPARTEAGSEPPSIAVLPFADLSPERDQEYFSDGLTEELIGALTKVEGLRVAARGVTFSYKGSARDPREIGRALNVRSVLEGSVRKEGDQLRITAQLIDVEKGYYLWSQSFDREITGIFAVQEEISRSIAEALRLQLAHNTLPFPRLRTGNIEAYNLYLRGRHFYNRQTVESLRKSIGYFEKAIAADPKYAPGYAGLADAYDVLVQYGEIRPREGMPKAKSAALKALSLDPSLAEAHVSLAAVIEAYDWNWDAAERAYRRAIELDPQLPAARLWYGMFLRDQGRIDEALPEIERAYQLDPLSVLANMNLGYAYAIQRKYDAAIDLFKKTLELQPEDPGPYMRLGALYREKARFEESLAAFERARQLSGEHPHTLAVLGSVYAQSGKRDEAMKVLEQLRQLSRRRWVPAFDMALIYSSLGDRERVMEYLEKAYEERSCGLLSLCSRRFEHLRSDPRFVALIKKIGLRPEVP